ncbi:restriction endonuclease subunit S [Mesorhizobium sp. M0058]|uniref:restriction endonuclease subunit S n=1 Tax=Mesorhizobium sp. M0058 TaxID=2956865 RepID=UPI003336A446
MVDLIDGAIRNGFSPNPPDLKTSRRVLSLSALTSKGLDATATKPAPEIEAVLRTELRDGDFLISRSNTRERVGFSAMFRGEVERCSYPDLMMRFRADPAKVVAEFLEQTLRGQTALSYLQSAASGTSSSMVKLTGPVVANTPVKIPPLPEQKKIAEILSTWDGAVETTEKLLANAEAQKRALTQQLLTGRMRLKGFGGPWLQKPLTEIVTRIQRKTDGGNHPILTISSTSGFIRQDEKYSRYMAGKSVENYLLLHRGEFAYNKGNSKTFEFGCVFDLEEFETGLVPHVYVCFRLNEGLSHRFFRALFSADYLRPQLGRLVNTGVRNNGLLNISPAQFLGTRVPVPSVAEQEALGTVLDAAAATVTQHRRSLRILKNEKSALMQLLLTGKTRVTV